MIRNILLFSVIILFFSACLHPKVYVTEAQISDCPLGYYEMTVVNNSEIDGCTFMVRDTANIEYEPINLHDSLRIEGKKICVKYQKENKMASICMSGQMIKITHVISK